MESSTPTSSSQSSGKRPKHLAKRKGSRNVSSPIVSPVNKRNRSNSVASSTTPGTFDASVLLDESRSRVTESSDLDLISTVPELKKVKCVGPMYRLLKPKSKNSLFAQIITHSPDIEHIVTSWLVMYKDDAYAGMDVLLSFFINLMGYQNVDINFTEDFNFYSLRNKLEQKLTKAHQNLKCLFRNTSTFAKTCIVACHAFLHDLICACDKCEILYETTFLDTLYNFMLEMLKSKNRIIIITICSLALKILTTLLEIEIQLENMSVLDKKHKQYLENLRQINRYLKVTLLNFSTMNDNFLSVLRQRSAEEFKFWISISDEMTFCCDIVKRIKKQLVDQYAFVRIAALTTCNAVVESGHLFPFIKDNKASFEKLCNIISGRLNDIHPNVEIMAIKFFTSLNRTKFAVDFVNVDVQNVIIKELYSPQFKLAQESSKFLTTFVDEEDTLKLIIEVAQKFKEGENIALLVHSIMGTVPEVLKLHVLMNCVLRESTSASKRVLLLEIFYHSAYISIKEDLCYNRDKKNIDILPTDANQYVGEIMLSNFTFLFKQFHEDENTILWILKIMNIIDIINPGFMRYRQDITEMIKYLIYLMVERDDPTVLTLLSEILSKLTADDYTFGQQHSLLFSEYLDYLIETYENYYNMTKGESVISEEVYLRVKQGILRISIITQHFNINRKLDWNTFYSHWTQQSYSEEILKYEVTCCQNYLKWEMQNLIEATKDNKQEVAVLKNHIRQFLKSCERINSLEPNDVTVVVFLNICKFLLEYTKVKNQASAKTLCDMLQFNFEKEDLLETFLVKIAFTHPFGTVSVRKDCLQRYVSLIFNNAIPHDKLFPIMKFYYLYKTDYKSIYDSILASFNRVDNKISTICIFKTLLYVYLKNENAKQQLEIANCFADDLSKKNCQMIIDLGLKYVKNHEQHVNFIVVIKAFTKKLYKLDKIKILQFIYDNFPADCLENPCFNLLFNELKPKGKHVAESVHTSERTSMETSQPDTSYIECSDDDYVIEEVDD